MSFSDTLSKALESVTKDIVDQYMRPNPLLAYLKREVEIDVEDVEDYEEELNENLYKCG